MPGVTLTACGVRYDSLRQRARKLCGNGLLLKEAEGKSSLF